MAVTFATTLQLALFASRSQLRLDRPHRVSCASDPLPIRTPRLPALNSHDLRPNDPTGPARAAFHSRVVCGVVLVLLPDGLSQHRPSPAQYSRASKHSCCLPAAPAARPPSPARR